MRKWIIAGVVVLFILVGVLGVALFSLNALIDRNKEYILTRVKEAVGREVTVKDIRVNLWGGVGARLDQFSVADDPTFGKEAFIRAANLQVNMKLLPLLRKELQVSKVILNRPVINIIKSQKGQFNFSTLGRQKQKKETGEESRKEQQGGSKNGTRPTALLVSLVDVDNGQIRYVDRSRGISVRADQIDLRLNDISFDHPIDVDLSAAVFGSEKQNLRVKGHVGPLAAKTEVEKMPVEGSLELDPVPLGNLEKDVPGLKQRYPQGVEMTGAIGAKAHFSANFGKQGSPEITGALNLADVSARVPELPQPISDINAKINFTGKSAELPETAFRIGKSQVRLAARVTSFTPLNLTYRISSPEIRLADVRAAATEPKKPEVAKDLTSEGTLMMKNGALSFRGNLSSTEGTIADADYRNLRASTSFVNHVATIETLTVTAFGGSLAAKGNYDMRESTPRFAMTTAVKAMDLKQIFDAVRPSAPQNIRGVVSMDLDVTGAGKNWKTI